MERAPVTVESVRNLQENGKRLLEGMLGQKLQENQQIFIMVMSPGTEPDEAARRQAHAGLTATFQKTEAYAAEHPVSDEEITGAIDEARRQVRRPKSE